MLMFKIMLLLLVANGTPILARRLLGQRLAHPVDGKRLWLDGRPVLGPSKTWLGLLAALALTWLAGLLLGLDAGIGLTIAAGAMTGDLLSSFIKRRLGIASSDMALFLDQVPESLFPLLLVAQPLQLSLLQITALTAAFFIIELILSKMLYELKIRKRPY